MAYEKVFCVHCGSDAIVKNGKSSVGTQRYYCRGIRDTARVLSVSIRTVITTIKKACNLVKVNWLALRGAFNNFNNDDVLLLPVGEGSLQPDARSALFRRLRLRAEERAQVGSRGHGGLRYPSHGPGLLHRRLQAAA